MYVFIPLLKKMFIYTKFYVKQKSFKHRIEFVLTYYTNMKNYNFGAKYVQVFLLSLVLNFI